MSRLLGREWFPTQDQAKWGTIDPVSRYYIEQWFAEREVFSNKRMEQWFWLLYGINLASYQNMLRIQAGNETFDPGVNRYLEALREYTSAVTGGGQSVSRSEKRSQNQHQIVHSAPDQVTMKRTEQHGARSGTETDRWDDKERNVTRNGTRTLHRTGDGASNYTRDGSGSQEVVKTQENRQFTVERAGKEITKDESMTAGRSASAVKAAPMTAINLSREEGAIGPGGSATDSFSKVANGTLGKQDWTSASQYSEDGTQGGTSAQREVSYDGDKRTETTLSDPESNQQIHTFSRNQETGIDIREDESFAGYGEKEVINGSESKSHSEEAYTDTVDDTETHSYGPVTDSGTGSASDETSGEESRHESKADEDWNRYTGREGLTPQEAFATGLKYLSDYPNAIYWFIAKLEPCFIGVIDDEEED